VRHVVEGDALHASPVALHLQQVGGIETVVLVLNDFDFCLA